MDEKPYAPPQAENQQISRLGFRKPRSNLHQAVWWMLGSAFVIGGFGSTLFSDTNPLGFVFVLVSPFIGLVLCLIVNAGVGRDGGHNSKADADIDVIARQTNDAADRLRDGE